jgi:hypothetical protein
MSQEPQGPMTHTNGNGTVPRLPQLRVHAFLAEGSPFRLPKFLTIEDAATVSGIPVARLAHFVEARAMPFVRIDEGPPLFYEPDLRAFVRALIRIVEPTGPIPEPICIYTDTFPPPTSIPKVLGEYTDRLISIPIEPPMCGVYFLMIDEVIMYVGSSVNVRARVGQHWLDGRRFNRTLVLPTLPENRLRIEYGFIRGLKPVWNRTGTGDDPEKLNLPESEQDGPVRPRRQPHAST